MIPLLTYEFLDYFNKLSLNDKILVEIGAGDSTLYWAKRFKKVISYEHDPEYYNDLLQKIDRENTEVNLFNKDIFKDPIFLKNIESADCIIIDNNPNYIPRDAFALFIRNNSKSDVAIVLDNSTWNLKAYSDLVNNFFVKDFPGTNRLKEITVTSLFNVRREMKYYNPKINYA